MKVDEPIRVADLDVKPGVTSDEGNGDEWPTVRQRVLGNEDGAHHVSAQLFQGLNDVGFTIPANGVTYWVGEAMHGTDYKELGDTPSEVATATADAARNAAHLARLLQTEGYPAAG